MTMNWGFCHHLLIVTQKESKDDELAHVIFYKCNKKKIIKKLGKKCTHTPMNMINIVLQQQLFQQDWFKR
jgi:hypothetical protein